MIPPNTRYRTGRGVHIVSVTPAEQRKRVHDAVAQRAFQICQMRKGMPGNPNEDWRRAESEICGALTCGFLVLEDRIHLSTDTKRFGEGDIEICVEPRRVTICGMESASKTPLRQESAAVKRAAIATFRSVDLPEEIEPSRVTANLRGRSLEIDLPRIIGRTGAAVRTAAA